MKLQSSLLALAATLASASPVSTSNGAVPESEIIEAMLRNEGLGLPKYTHRMLEARVGQLLSKRQTTTAAGAPKGIDFGSLLSGLASSMSGLGGLQGGASSRTSVAPNSTVAEVQDTPSTVWKDAKKRKIRYGPYRIPPTSEKNFESQILQIAGMSNTLKIGAKKPCDAECTVLSLVADMEYFDGEPMKTKDAWLHHVVLLNSGPKIVEPNCGATRVENMFMDGNERTMNGYALPNSPVKSGYHLFSQDNFILTTELMNLEDKEKWAWVTLTYEYLDGPHPDYKQGKNVWMTIGPPIAGCGKSVTSPWGPSNLTWAQQPKSDKFIEHSMPWNATQDGLILSTGGHMHDGGVNTEIYKNKDKICDSLPHYAFAKPMAGNETAGHGHGSGMAKRQMGDMSGSNSEIAHIEKQDPCIFPEGLPMKKGDSLYLAVDYDFKKYPGMKNKKGELDEVMGIVGMLVAF